MDLLLVNGNIVTMDAARSKVQALAVHGDRVSALGDNGHILAYRRAHTKIIDLKGKTVVPGFNDSHMHLINYGLSLDSVDLSSCRTLLEVRDKMDRHVRNHNIQGSWVYGWGWNQESFAEKRMPQRQDIDGVWGDNFVVLMRTCNHVCVANTKALQLAGIEEVHPLVTGGEVHVDSQGRATGILKENAMKLVKNHMPQRDKKYLQKTILKAARNCLQMGLTSLQTDDFGVVKENYRDVLDAYLDLDRDGLLPVRINKQLLLQGKEKLASFLELGYKTGDGSLFFKIGPLKLLLDGSLGARTAALNAPYDDDPDNLGITLLSYEELAELVATADHSGLQVAVHAIGDKAMDMSLTAFSRAQNPKDKRFRIIHCSIANGEIIKKFRRYGVLADVQPSFVASDYYFTRERLGAERAPGAYCLKSFLRAGIPLAGGSDCPIESCNPLLGIHAAVTRTNPAGQPEGGWMPYEKLTVEEALYMFTRGSAYSTYEENLKGSLTPGKLADMAVLSEDLWQVRPEEICRIEVLMTMVGGKVLHTTMD